jgi:hypothetical protein
MNDPQPNSPRRRLQELLAIPERLRTDEQWDELNELEISLTPINREGAAERAPRREHPAQNNRPKTSPPAAPGKKPFNKKPHRRPPKANTPERG